MKKTAAAIIRAANWEKIQTTAPILVSRKFRKALIDTDCTVNQAFLAFMYAVGTGELKVVPKPISRTVAVNRVICDSTGVFDDYRAFLVVQNGKIINPMPYANKYIEDI